jgi:hypothetical protein
MKRAVLGAALAVLLMTPISTAVPEVPVKGRVVSAGCPYLDRTPIQATTSCCPYLDRIAALSAGSRCPYLRMLASKSGTGMCPYLNMNRGRHPSGSGCPYLNAAPRGANHRTPIPFPPRRQLRRT